MIEKTLSHYRILAQLGRGGMGIVYKAHDERLDRPVALKILKPELLGDAESRRRFLGEALAAAAVTHPYIAAVYEAGEADGVHFIAMEFVEGRTLRELLQRGRLRSADVQRYALEIAEGLAYAHRAGLVHRDLKPENVMVRLDGHVKILDFGLAKLMEGMEQTTTLALSGATAALANETEEGKILGTLAYMSPEQARGAPVDRRSDVFSFGSTLYEMATGEALFRRATPQDTLAAILHEAEHPDLDLGTKIPSGLEIIIDRCLQRDPAERFNDTRDLVHALQDLGHAVARDEEASRGARFPNRGVPRVHVALVAVALAAIGVSVWLLARRPETPIPPAAALVRLTDDRGQELFPSLSPDGRLLVYAAAPAGQWDIFLKRAAGQRAIDLTEDSVADDTQPAFSPDGAQIAFRSERDGGGIFVMGATGESVRRLTDFGFNPTWSPDGTELIVAREGVGGAFDRLSRSWLWIVKVATGEHRQVYAGDAVQPQWSPDAGRIAFWTQKTGGQRDIFTIPAHGGEPRPVTEDAATDWSPAWSPDGSHLYFCSDRGGNMNIWRIPVDEKTGAPRGDPRPVVSGTFSRCGPLAISADGSRLAFVSTVSLSNIHRVAFDPQTGQVDGTPIPTTSGSRQFWDPSPSPDGEWVAFRSMQEQEDLFVSRWDGSGLRQLTHDTFKDRGPAWSPDGERIAFYSDRSGNYEIWTIRPDGSDLRQVTRIGGSTADTPVWSPDASRIAFTLVYEKKVLIVDATRPWSEQVPDTLPPLGTDGAFFRVSSWTPDGSRLLGHRFELGGISAFSFESRTYEDLTDRGWWPRALSDSRRMIFWLDGRGYLFEAEDQPPREILHVPGFEVGNRLRVTPDSRWIFLTLGEIEADIWSVELQ